MKCPNRNVNYVVRRKRHHGLVLVFVITVVLFVQHVQKTEIGSVRNARRKL